MIFTIIVVSLFVFKAPDYTWLSVPICFGYFLIKAVVKGNMPGKFGDDDNEELNWWIDDHKH